MRAGKLGVTKPQWNQHCLGVAWPTPLAENRSLHWCTEREVYSGPCGVEHGASLHRWEAETGKPVITPLSGCTAAFAHQRSTLASSSSGVGSRTHSPALHTHSFPHTSWDLPSATPTVLRQTCNCRAPPLSLQGSDRYQRHWDGKTCSFVKGALRSSDSDLNEQTHTWLGTTCSVPFLGDLFWPSSTCPACEVCDRCLTDCHQTLALRSGFHRAAL